MAQILCRLVVVLLLAEPFLMAQETTDQAQVVETLEEESGLQTDSIFLRAWRGGIVVFSVLLVLIGFSVLSWALLITKFIFLRKLGAQSTEFISSFWVSRSLNELNSKLANYPDSPAKQVFGSGYAELARGSQMRELASSNPVAAQAVIDNLGRSLHNAKIVERRKMEAYLSVLAIIASASPFIGLFGTVWGIMGAFEGIARTGSASLAAVAPGISEALIATAFGLAAAIPAVIGYNIAQNKIRGLMGSIDGFSSDFINIVERHLVTDKLKSTGNTPI